MTAAVATRPTAQVQQKDARKNHSKHLPRCHRRGSSGSIFVVRCCS